MQGASYGPTRRKGGLVCCLEQRSNPPPENERAMIKHLVGGLRAEAHPERARGRMARWLGRAWARLNYATRVEPTWLELNHHDVHIRGLAPAFDGFKIVQMSDFHCSRRVTAEYLTEAV